MRSLLTLFLLTTPWLASASETPFQRCFELASERHGVATELLIGVARVESNFNPGARSHAGAHGIMQVRWPQTARHLGVHRVSELYNPCVNIDVGASYLSELLQRFNGNERLALAAYNYGPTRLRTVSDIPPGVDRYVDKVQALSPRQPVRQARRVELNRFTSRHRAERYRKALLALAPGSAISVTRAPGGQYVVQLEPGTLTTWEYNRLSQLMMLR